jgi:DNA repair protein RecN (Recombination protein N)
LQQRVDDIQRVMNKHRKASDLELFNYQQDIASKLSELDRSSDDLGVLKQDLNILEVARNSFADELTRLRRAVANELGELLTNELRELGMPDAQLKISVERKDGMNLLGQDVINVLFSANKGQPLQDVSKVASGGELSRLMLVIKAEMARNAQLPTIIFDEIDTGVSGEVAERMGLKIKMLGDFMQVLCITHLPQIAAKGKHHLFVYKDGEGERTVTRIRELSGSERVLEIAKMLSSDNPSEAAIIHAGHLVNQE